MTFYRVALTIKTFMTNGRCACPSPYSESTLYLHLYKNTAIRVSNRAKYFEKFSNQARIGPKLSVVQHRVVISAGKTCYTPQGVSDVQECLWLYVPCYSRCCFSEWPAGRVGCQRIRIRPCRCQRPCSTQHWRRSGLGQACCIRNNRLFHTGRFFFWVSLCPSLDASGMVRARCIWILLAMPLCQKVIESSNLLAGLLTITRNRLLRQRKYQPLLKPYKYSRINLFSNNN